MHACVEIRGQCLPLRSPLHFLRWDFSLNLQFAILALSLLTSAGHMDTLQAGSSCSHSKHFVLPATSPDPYFSFFLSCCVALTGLELAADHPASASQVLELQACTILPQPLFSFLIFVSGILFIFMCMYREVCVGAQLRHGMLTQVIKAWGPILLPPEPLPTHSFFLSWPWVKCINLLIRPELYVAMGGLILLSAGS